MKKQTLALLMTLVITCMLCACGGNDTPDTTETQATTETETSIETEAEAKAETQKSTKTPTTIKKYETANKEAIASAVKAMDGQTLALQEDMYWGMTYNEVKKHVKEPYIYDSGDYLANAFYAMLPCNDKWKDENGNVNPDEFLSSDVLAYYSVDASVGLYEYGYMMPDVDLYEYDFLKEYYTNKYGEPVEETWEWNDETYEPTGDEDYYQMFRDGLVKVVTVWDIKKLDAVLVIDWLNDPQKYNNNFGQISFYNRSDDFDVNAVEDIDSSLLQ